MQSVIAVIVVAVVGATYAQFFGQQPGELSFAIQPPPLQQNFQPVPFANQQPKRELAHPALVHNAQLESQLPPQLLNPFYKNPRIAAALAKESWFAPGENQVYDREAEKIPREKIYSVLKNAGLVRRRRWSGNANM